jgi:tetratricopeptide (TPR) repeat protein
MIDPSPQAGIARVAPGWHHWLPRIATAVLVPVLLFGIVEAALRICEVGIPTSVTHPCTVQGHPAFCDNLFFTATFFPPGIVRTPRPYAIPAKKPPETFRIFILGESAAYGDPDPAYGFSRYLEVMLRERFPAIKFEVINTGITAIDSHVLLPIAKDLARHQPDLFVVYAGNNEVVGPYGPGTVFSSAAMSLPAIRASIFVRSTRIGQLLAKVAGPKKQQPRDWRGMEMFLDKQIRADSPLMERAYANLAANLHDIVSVARGSGARVVLSTVATNLKDCAPFASLHREDLGQDALRSWEELVQRGAAFESAGAYADALKLYSAAAEIDPQYAELQFRIARCLWMLGDYPAAKEHFVRAQDLDTLRFRADSRTNDIIRSSATGPGVALVDTAKIFAEESLHGVAGSELLYEHVHMTPRGNYLIARGLFQPVAGMLLPEAKRFHPGNDPPSEMDCDRLLALTRYDRSRVATEVLWRLERPPFTNQLDHSEQLLRLRIEAEAGSDSYEETVAQYRWAIARNPEDRMLHLKFGLFLLQRNRAAAVEEFRSARPYDGFPVIMPDGTVVN